MGGRQKNYSVNCKDYELREEVGHGASAIVYRAIYIPSNDVVAVKCLDLDRCNCNLDDVRREAQTMILIDHPNVINAHCSFVVGHNLWVVMPFMAEGSCLHLMKIAHPDGFEESVIVSILKETLKALEYLHEHGHIHRDVKFLVNGSEIHRTFYFECLSHVLRDKKAGNILLHTNGEVKLADFGVSASMFDRGDRQWSRNTFVGTPCWMAPEVLQPGNGYDFKADIWSFGITALELAHGHAPFSKYPPMKVLLMTIQNAPPGLDYDRDKKFSKSFKEMVAMCLVKDQTKRPTVKKLLKHSFFKNAKPPELSIKRLFADLPPLWNRVRSIELKDAADVALKRMPSAEQEALSQSEYQRGVSAWNFDIDDLKCQASLLQEEHEEFNTIDANGIHREQINGNGLEAAERPTKGVETVEDDIIDPGNLEKLEFRKNGSKTERTQQALSGPLAPGQVVGQSISTCNLDRPETEHQLPNGKAPQVRKAPSSSGLLMLPRRASSNSLSAPVKSSGGYGESLDDKSVTNLVQIRGRFSITSENLDLVTPNGQTTKDTGKSNVHASTLTSHLQNLFQQTSIQQDLIMSLLNSLQPAEIPDASLNWKLPPVHPISENGNVDGAISEKERLLLQRIAVLQARINNLNDELTTERSKCTQLQQQINVASGDEVKGERRLSEDSDQL